MKRMLEKAREAEKLLDYVRQNGNTTELGGNVYVDGTLEAKGVERYDYSTKYHIGTLVLRETLTTSDSITMHYTINFSNITFYSDTTLTNENFSGFYKDILKALTPVGVAMFQQEITGVGTTTIYGIATVTPDEKIVCFYSNQGTTTTAIYDFDEHLTLVSCDMLNLTDGERIEA